MSVTTTADERRDDIKMGVDSAIQNIAAIVIEHVWGWDDFSSEYRTFLSKTLFELIELREKL